MCVYMSVCVGKQPVFLQVRYVLGCVCIEWSRYTFGHRHLNALVQCGMLPSTYGEQMLHVENDTLRAPAAASTEKCKKSDFDTKEQEISLYEL